MLAIGLDSIGYTILFLRLRIKDMQYSVKDCWRLERKMDLINVQE
jgi:hypothetical protein